MISKNSILHLFLVFTFSFCSQNYLLSQNIRRFLPSHASVHLPCGTMTTFVARVTNGNGKNALPVPNVTVTFTATAGSPASFTTVTNSNGEASYPHTMADVHNTTYHVTASIPGASVNWNVKSECQTNCNAQAICQNITVALTGNSVTISPETVGGSSNICNNQTSSLSPNTFTCSNLGENVVTYSILNAGGITLSSCNAIITVVDITPPVAFCYNELILNLDDSGMASVSLPEIDAGSFDNCGGHVTMSLSNAAFDCDDVGTTQIVTLNVTDVSGNNNFCISTVEVVDNISPIAYCISTLAVALDPTGHATIQPEDVDLGSFDNCGTITMSLSDVSFDCSDLGAPQFVSLNVIDENGNTNFCTMTVELVDYINPIAYCKAFITAFLDDSGNATITPEDIDLGSIDNCGNITMFLSNDSFDCSDLDIPQLVSLNVVDASGNTNFCTMTVQLVDYINPIAYCVAFLSVALDATGNATIIPEDIDLGSYDNCGAITMSLSNDSFDCSDVDIPQMVTLNVVDGSGNSNFCIATVLVLDNMNSCEVGSRMVNHNSIPASLIPELEVKLFPTLSNDGKFNLQVDNIDAEDLVNVAVNNSMGQLVYATQIPFLYHQILDLGELPDGLYIVNLTDSLKKKSIKVVVDK